MTWQSSSVHLASTTLKGKVSPLVMQPWSWCSVMCLEILPHLIISRLKGRLCNILAQSHSISEALTLILRGPFSSKNFNSVWKVGRRKSSQKCLLLAPFRALPFKQSKWSCKYI